MDDSSAELIAPLADIDEVYFDEAFDSLAQVMNLLSDSTPEDAREACRRRRDRAKARLI